MAGWIARTRLDMIVKMMAQVPPDAPQRWRSSVDSPSGPRAAQNLAKILASR